MPRRSRIDAPGALHHIIVRGIEGINIFKDDADRDNFLDRLKNILTDSDTLAIGGNWGAIGGAIRCNWGRTKLTS